MTINNNNLFNAALSGAATGLTSRALTNTDPASYADQAALITSFATEFDAQIGPIVGGGSRGQADVVSDICAAYWRDRFITSSAVLTTAAETLAAVYTALASDILPDTGGVEAISLSVPEPEFAIPIFVGVGQASVPIAFAGVDPGDTFAITWLPEGLTPPNEILLGTPYVAIADTVIVPVACINAGGFGGTASFGIRLTRFMTTDV